MGENPTGDTVSDRNVPYRTGYPHATRYLPEESVVSFVTRVVQDRLGAAFRSAGR